MRPPGIGEIIVILVVIFIVILVIRISKMSKSQQQTRHNESSQETKPSYVTSGNDKAKQESRTRLVLIGILIALVGVVVLLSSLSLFKWVYWGPVAAVIAMLAGIGIVLLARRR